MTTIKSSEQLNEIFSALSKAQALIDNVVSDKQAYNYKYADLGSVIAAIREPFAKHGLSVIQMPFSVTDENSIVRDGLSTRICHESGQWIESEMLSPIGGQGKSAIQNMGSNITYMRRYMLAAMAGVTQVDDETKLMGNNEKQYHKNNQHLVNVDEKERAKLIKRCEQEAQKGADHYFNFWTTRLTNEQKSLIGANEQERIKRTYLVNRNPDQRKSEVQNA